MPTGEPTVAIGRSRTGEPTNTLGSGQAFAAHAGVTLEPDGNRALVGLLVIGILRLDEVRAAGATLRPGTTLIVLMLFVVANGLLAENWCMVSRAGGAVGARGRVWRVFAISQPLRCRVPGGHIGTRGVLASRGGLSIRAGVGLGELDLVLSVASWR